MADKYNQRWVLRFARPGVTHFAITTDGNTTCYSCPEAEVTPKWRAHELCHQEQYRRLGWFGFLAAYTAQYLANRRAGMGHWEAYAAIPLEVEARAAADAAPTTESADGAV